MLHLCRVTATPSFACHGRRTSNYKASHEMYYRGFINRGELPAKWNEDRAAGDVADEKKEGVLLRKRWVVIRVLGGVGVGCNPCAG